MACVRPPQAPRQCARPRRTRPCRRNPPAPQIAAALSSPAFKRRRPCSTRVVAPPLAHLRSAPQSDTPVAPLLAAAASMLTSARLQLGSPRPLHGAPRLHSASKKTQRDCQAPRPAATMPATSPAPLCAARPHVAPQPEMRGMDGEGFEKGGMGGDSVPHPHVRDDPDFDVELHRNRGVRNCTRKVPSYT